MEKKLYDIPTLLAIPEINQPLRAENILGMYKTVSSVPTNTPKNCFDQIVLYVNGNSLKLYFYDVTNSTWRPMWVGDFVGTGFTSVTQTASPNNITISS